MQADAAARWGGLRRKMRGKSSGWIIVGNGGTNPVENKFIDIFILIRLASHTKKIAFLKCQTGLTRRKYLFQDLFRLNKVDNLTEFVD